MSQQAVRRTLLCMGPRSRDGCVPTGGASHPAVYRTLLCIAPCCVWGRVAAERSESPANPCPMSKAPTMGQSAFSHADHCVHCLPGEEMPPGCTVGRRQASGGGVMLSTMQGKPGSVYSCGCQFDPCHLSKHHCGPGTPLHGNRIPLRQQDSVPCQSAVPVCAPFLGMV